jgi:exopolysaccharide biosynthesis polyprenyl glycosylphosphotransferase
MIAIRVAGAYRVGVFGAGVDEYKRIANASLATAAAVGISCYLLRFTLPRGFFVLTFLIGVPLLVTGRFLLRRSLHQARRRGALLHRVVIVGSEGHVDEIASVLRRETWLGYNVIGALTPLLDGRPTTHSGIPLLGNSQSVADVVLETGADVVFLAGGAFDSAAAMRRLAWELETHDVQVVIAPSVTDVSSERVSIRPVGGLPLIHLEKPRSQAAGRRAKRFFDILATLSLLFAAAPLFAFAAIRIKAHDGGPIMFRQTRVGRDGKKFTVLKFRTMVTNAEQLLAQLHEEQGYDGGLFKMQDDPRVTTPGAWLRRFSIDELPQLFNVLKGDMSLVGPRPPLAHEVAQYDEEIARRLRVRPGMTGLWQVSGRSELSWSEAVRLDLYYVDNWSMVQDMTILARTLGAVTRAHGAY